MLNSLLSKSSRSTAKPISTAKYLQLISDGENHLKITDVEFEMVMAAHDIIITVQHRLKILSRLLEMKTCT